MYRRSFWHLEHRSFTFLEIIVALVLIAVLVGLFILFVKPQELFKRARDLRRIGDLNDIDVAIRAALLENSGLQLGESNTIYLSLPDTSATCSSWVSQLPVLQAGWRYRCVPEANLTKINGSGWVPVDLTGVKSKGFLALPVDPINRPPYYYSYVRGSTHLTALLEYLQEPAKKDNGSSDCLFEAGTQRTISPKWFLEGRAQGCVVEKVYLRRRPPIESGCLLPEGCAKPPGFPDEGNYYPENSYTTSSEPSPQECPSSFKLECESSPSPSPTPTPTPEPGTSSTQPSF